MSPDHPFRSDLVGLLDAAEGGEPGSLDRLVPLLYDELRAIAHRQLEREKGPRTLRTTALVHEAYLRLAGDDGVAGRGRAYFFAAAAKAMRQVLVDRARRRKARKRGGDAEVITLDPQDAAVDAFAVELLDLDRALHRLERRSGRQARVVEYRFFGGMSVPETAEALGVSTRTVESDWAMARAWLFDALGSEPERGSGEGAG
jgi:RNA polymerase sigma factor (TIGR02999 family)